MNPLSNLEPTEKRYCYKTEENDNVQTQKHKALSVSVSVKLFYFLEIWDTFHCLACDQNLPNDGP